MKSFFFLIVIGFMAFGGKGLQPVMAGTDSRSDLRELLQAEPDLILDVLRDHPIELMEILEKALIAKREHDRLLQEQADLNARHDPRIFPDRPVRGNPDAPITIVEYSDFLCPFCSTAAGTIKELMESEGDAVRLVYKHHPLNPVSRELALSFEALALQDHEAAWQLHDALFARQAEVRADYEKVLADVVSQTGVDQGRFAADRSSQDVQDLLKKDLDEARRFGFSGAPMFLVNGVPLRGAVPLHEFQRVIELVRPEPETAPSR